MRQLEVISLIFNSVDYLEFVYNSFIENTKSFNDVEVLFRFVANDASIGVLDYLIAHNIKHTVYNDPIPDDYYLNRVYRCWNHSVLTSNANLVCLVNSDMAFSSDWLEILYKEHEKGNLPTSRLIESGKLLSGEYAYSKNFGTTPQEFKKNDWLTFVNSFRTDLVKDGGLFMPVIFDVDEFKNSSYYPEGNIYSDGAGTLNGNVIESGDKRFFREFSLQTGRKHVTVFNSLVYHIQEGEKDDASL